MTLPPSATLLRVFIGEDARADHRPVCKAIVEKAREFGLAGGTVLRSRMGYGHSGRLRSTRTVDEDKIKAFLPILDAMMPSGLVTLEKVQVLQYGGDIKRAPP